MELPWRCRSCGVESMIDPENLASWPLDKVMTAHGFTCENCGIREAVAYATLSLHEQMRKLTCYAPEHPKFTFLFQKVLRKAKGVNRRGELIYGEIGRKNLAAA